MKNEHLEIQKEYWDKIALGAKNEVAVTRFINAEGLAVSKTMFQDIGNYIIKKHTKNKNRLKTNVLEIGCGNGLIQEQILKMSSNIQMFGTDISKEVLNKNINDIELHQCDAADLPFQNDFFDLIYLHSVVQYFGDINYFNSANKEIIRVLKKGGSIFFLDVPLDWYTVHYKEVTLRTILINRIPFFLKSFYRTINKRKFIEEVDGTVITLDKGFSGFYPNVEDFYKYKEIFEYVDVEIQPYNSKPLLYRKYRVNVLLNYLTK